MYQRVSNFNKEDKDDRKVGRRGQ